MRWFLVAVFGSLAAGRDEPFPASVRQDERDPDLDRRLAEQDPDAFVTLYDRHARDVFSLAFRILGDQTEAEDVVQEVFAQAWRQAGRFEPQRGQPVAWLLNMTRSRAVDLLRRRRHEVLVDPDHAPVIADPESGADVAAISADDARAVRSALARLPYVQRVAIELAYYEGLSQAEIAERLEQPLGTVKTRVRLGLLKLREAMGGSRG